MATQFALTGTWSYPPLDSSAQTLRNDMKKMIAELAQVYTQSDLDEKIYIDVDDDGNILGMDLSVLIGLSSSLSSFHNSIKLGDMTDDIWSNMKLYKANSN